MDNNKNIVAESESEINIASGNLNSSKDNEKEKSQSIKAQKPESGKDNSRSGIVNYLSGDKEDYLQNLKTYLPYDLIGGSVPYVPGHEEEAVWNAASQACATEKIHFVYTITLEDKKIWYLACPSSSFASNPDSWCPLAAALPGNSEFWDRETVYIYEQDMTAGALRWDFDTGRMQVYVGTSRTLLPKIQSMEASNFVNIDPEVLDPVPWKNRALKTEKLSRITAVILLLAGLAVNIICFLIISYQYISLSTMQRDLEDVKSETISATQELMISAVRSMHGGGISHMIRIQELLDALSVINGTLTKYEVSDNGKISWEALIPSAFTSGKIAGANFEVMGMESDGRVRIKGSK